MMRFKQILKFNNSTIPFLEKRLPITNKGADVVCASLNDLLLLRVYAFCDKPISVL